MGERDFSDPSEGIFMYTTEGIFIVDQDGMIIRANPSAEKIFGYPENTLAGRRIEDLIPKRYHKSHPNHRKSFHGESQARSMGLGRDLYGLRLDGSEFPVEISLSPFSNSTGNFVIAFVIDISVRKEAELKLIAYKDELEKKVEERTLDLRSTIESLETIKNDLDDALKREQELGSMKSRFVSIASHEFRTPLATILSSLSLVEKYGNLNEIEKRDRHIQRIKSAVRNLTEILNDFLSLNRLEEGKVVISSETFEVDILMEEVYNQVLPLLKKDQTIVRQHTGSLRFKSDPRLITNILLNLLSNAIKFSANGKTIRLSSHLDDKGLVLKVKDEGIGIPAGERKRVFERFYRMSNAGEIQGTGLGLSIVSHYVTLLNGTISFESTENVGTEFTVVLPES
ncbi:PAS/PAC sensor signal transduction histidine kinase [Leadbetterella byssophila DSM 17132]|uniref:histidine kinase n=1 Tax=Leadbetterella byssophila (strain DSM 17132 / JCM 16389 / KACC 11308 / NBRC 106382 / 4M15) TaxID=649349 RepID=E4RQX2_LEAB4|nr:PAS domain-containing sensor histidine kinase [Leadbetterella byssophila]ADQ18415.1 PAS/PAC sensor signal transduction histidine kinase [Leadbetterella byssophila DSM 17132]